MTVTANTSQFHLDDLLVVTPIYYAKTPPSLCDTPLIIQHEDARAVSSHHSPGNITKAMSLPIKNAKLQDLAQAPTVYLGYAVKHDHQGDWGMARILLVDDVEDVREGLAAVLEAAGHHVTPAADGREAIAVLTSQQFDLVITDIMMPECDGTEVIMRLESLSDRPPVLAISGGAPSVPAYMALHLARLKADATLMKPFSNDELMTKVNALLPK